MILKFLYIVYTYNGFTHALKGITLPKKKPTNPTRQLFANIDEEIYLNAKSKAASERLPMRTIIEQALFLYLAQDSSPLPSDDQEGSPGLNKTVWDDEYIGMQVNQPLGSPVELTELEAERIAREAFN